MPTTSVRWFAPLIVTGLALLAHGVDADAQNFDRLGTSFEALRSVRVPLENNPAVATAAFHHHGLIDARGANVAVISTKTRDAVPSRVLQLGPGDFCRIAFEVDPGVGSYDLLYGGEPPREGEVPEFKSNVGLLLETREFVACNLNSVDEVMKAFDKAKPIGAGYVSAVHHSRDPWTPRQGAFLSRYTGTIRIPTRGEYAFHTASQDASFLRIDGKTIASAPGRHGPQRSARPETGGRVTLDAGPHQFEYHHAATSPEAIMVAAWEFKPGEKFQPEAIPPEAFGAQRVVDAAVGPLVLDGNTSPPDFAFDLRGDVPLPDNPDHLIGVAFRILSTNRGDITWDFGDGQTSDRPNPIHVFLKPGLYTVSLTFKNGNRETTTANRVYVDQPFLTDKDELHDLDTYLPVLDGYDFKTLDAPGLRQAVEAYLFKAEQLRTQADELEAKAEEAILAARDDPESTVTQRDVDRLREKVQTDTAQLRKQALTAIAKAVVVGKTPFVGPSATEGEEALYELARQVGPLARDELGDSKTAGQIWHGASKRLATDENVAHCLAMSADIALNDLLSPASAKPMLEEAQKRLAQTIAGETSALALRVRGDLLAATGQGDAARQAYQTAETRYSAADSFFDQTAWLGAYSRSTEQYLKSGELGRAAAELRRWQDDFPTARIEGYHHLLMARYWQAREKYAQAAALADQLLTVTPDSPYIDRLLMISAECDVAREQKDRAIATLQTLVKDYPGSPLVEDAKAKIAELRAEK